MARKIMRDIEAKKNIQYAGNGEGIPVPTKISVSAEKNTRNKRSPSPHVLDLSQEAIVNTGINVSNSKTDISKNQNDSEKPTMIVARKMTRPSVFLQLSWIGILGLFIIFLLNTAKGYATGQKLFTKIAQSAKQGYGQLLEGGQKIKQLDSTSANSIFEEAYSQFEKAQEQIWFMKNEPTLSKYTGILESGKLLADSGKQMIDMMAQMKTIPDLFAQNVNHVDETRAGSNEQTALSKIQELSPKIAQIHQNIQQVLENFTALTEQVPSQYKAVFTQGINLLTSSEKLIGEVMNMLPGLAEIMGSGNKPHHTLILLQNNDEVRGTGGFIGSFMNLEMQNGYVTSLKFEDVYDLDGQFAAKKDSPIFTPPDEIKRLTSRWFFRDANVAPDFRTAGEKALWLYAQEKGELADTVLAVNRDILGKMLEITGPIEVPGLTSLPGAAPGVAKTGAAKAGPTKPGIAVPLTADNYREVLTYMVETKQSGLADPKKTLRDLMPLIQKRLFQPAHIAQFQQLFLEEIVQKNVVGYSKNPLVENLFETVGMDGAIMPEVRNEDYLSVIASSFGGNKSDAYIKQELSHDTVIERSGEMYDQLTIKRTHQWTGATEQKWRSMLKPLGMTDFSDSLLGILGKSENKVAMRVYVPSGSQLISSDGVAVDQIKNIRDPDLNRSYFAFDIITKPGETTTMKMRYKLPFSLDSFLANTYIMNVQKQLGAHPSIFTKHLMFNDFMSFASAYPNEFVMEDDGSLMLGKSLSKDLRLALLMTRDSVKK